MTIFSPLGYSVAEIGLRSVNSQIRIPILPAKRRSTRQGRDSGVAPNVSMMKPAPDEKPADSDGFFISSGPSRPANCWQYELHPVVFVASWVRVPDI